MPASGARRVAIHLLRVVTGHQARPRRPAPGGVVHLREAQPARRQFVQVRCRDLAPITSDVAKTHVVCKNQNNVGPEQRIVGHPDCLAVGAGSAAAHSRMQAKKNVLVHPIPGRAFMSSRIQYSLQKIPAISDTHPGIPSSAARGDSDQTDRSTLQKCLSGGGFTPVLDCRNGWRGRSGKRYEHLPGCFCGLGTLRDVFG